MVATVSVSIAHGLAIADIREVSALIRKDDGSKLSSIVNQATTYVIDGAVVVNGANIFLSRKTGGSYDNVDYDLTPFNRGWIVIKYV